MSRRRLLRLNPSERRSLSVALAYSLVLGAVALVIPLVLRQVLDAALYQQEVSFLVAGAAIVAVVGRAWGSGYANTFIRAIGERVICRMRADLFARVLNLRFSTFQAINPGDVLSRLNSDISMLRTAYIDSVISGSVSGLRVTGTIIILIWLSWRVGLFVLIAMAAAVGYSHLATRRMREIARQVQEHVARSTTIAHDALRVFSTIRLYGMAPTYTTRYHTQSPICANRPLRQPG